MTKERFVVAALLLILGPVPVGAQDAMRLREQFPAGYHYQVSLRVELTGSLTLPATPKAAAPQPLKLTGASAIDYDERILTSGKDGQAQKTIRLYRRMDFQRKVGEQQQQSTLRPEVRRLVVLRQQQHEVPFSPDGPLTWNEIDLIRTDVFTPALAGLLPEGAVRLGDRWNATLAAVQELTDLQKIDNGGIVCKLDQLTTLSNRKHARISLNGDVRGIGEDGSNRQQLEGSVFFDLESSHVSYLSLQGTRQLIDKDGKVAGAVRGTFVLTRQPRPAARELSDEALRGLTLEPNENNSMVLYDNPEVGVHLLHPRNWRVADVRGRQVALDETRGSGLLLTLDTLAKVPTAGQFLQESRTYLQQQKATVLRVDNPRLLQAPPRQIEHFALDVEMSRQRALMDYYVLRQSQGGATIAARLLPADLATVRKDTERIARSVVVTK